MTQRPRWAVLCAVAAVLLAAPACALAQTATAPSVAAATKPATKPAAKVPYTLDPIPQIANLKPAPNTPAGPDDLKAIQARVEAVTKYALPAIVNILVSDGEGSGVIVSKDGYVLTAGHVSGAPNTDIYLRLSNGTIVAGKTLGANDLYDAGMVKITTPGNYAFMPVGSTSKMTAGQWVVAMGHPGGFQEGRSPVMRLGKVLNINVPTKRDPEWYMQTDCPIIMGDSGGPVFDLDGRVVAINSRIGVKSTSNVHVPIDAFTDAWDRLAKGDQWGGGILARLNGGNPPAPPVGAPKATMSLSVKDLKVLGVLPDKAAEKAGVLAEDVITKFNGEAVKTDDELSANLAKHAPGETVTLDLLRRDPQGNAKPVQAKLILDAK